MKHILLILAVLPSILGCAGSRVNAIIDKKLSYDHLNEAIVIFPKDNIAVEGVNEFDPEGIYLSMIDAFRQKYPILKIFQESKDVLLADSNDNPQYELKASISRYLVQKTQGAISEKVNHQDSTSETKHYVTYTTKTSLFVKVSLLDVKNGSTVWLAETTTRKSLVNKEEDECHDSNVLDSLVCQVIVKPALESILDGVVNAVLPEDIEINLDTPYPEPESINNMVKYAVYELVTSLPRPSCKQHGYKTCIKHFFRTNTFIPN